MMVPPTRVAVLVGTPMMTTGPMVVSQPGMVVVNSSAAVGMPMVMVEAAGASGSAVGSGSVGEGIVREGSPGVVNLEVAARWSTFAAMGEAKSRGKRRADIAMVVRVEVLNDKLDAVMSGTVISFGGVLYELYICR